MTILDLHIELSYSIGDGINYVSGNIPDGVRYTKVLRDKYINRAQLQVFQFLLNKAMMLPRKQRAIYLQRLVPNMIFNENILVSSFAEESTISTPTDALPLFVYPPLNGKLSLNLSIAEVLSAYLSIPSGTTTSQSIKRGFSIPLPIKTQQEANTLVNSYIVQDHDPFIVCSDADVLADTTYRTNLGLHLYSHYPLPSTATITTNILYYPLEIQNYTNITDTYIFEERFIPIVLQYATLYAMQDDQEIQNFEQVFPMIMQTSMGG